MKSHEYKTVIGDWLKAILPTLTVIVGLAAILKAADRLGLLPSPPIFSEPGSIVLAHQSAAARAGLAGEIVLLGDSTCLMDVDAPTLQASLPGNRPVINLGLIAWLSFEDYAGLFADHSAASHSQITTVVLLVTPNKLTLSGEDAHAMIDVWQQIRHQGKGASASQTSPQSLANWLSCEILRKNLLSYWLVKPLEGKSDGAVFFGFPTDIDNYMTTHQGSLIELGTFKPLRRREEWSMSPSPELETQSRIFREKIPRGARLIVGLTPIQESGSSMEERRQRAALLLTWSLYLKADGVLTNLPPQLPDVFFAAGGHLNPVGQKRFTSILAREMIPFLKPGE